MASPDQIKTALLTEHFRYTPLTLLDDIINTVNELVFQAVNAVEEGLLNADHEALGFKSSANGLNGDNEGPSTDSAARTEIESGIVQLESLLNATIDKNFDKLEIYTLRNLLTVSNLKEDEGLENWVMLDHYRNLDSQSLGTSNIPSPQSIQRLRRKVQETERLHTALRAEAARNEALLARLKPLLSGTPSAVVNVNSSTDTGVADQQQHSLAFLASNSKVSSLGASPTKPLSQNTQFTISQLPALKSLLESLRPHIQSVPEAGSSTAAEARDAYIESQSRRAIARKGLNSDATGEAGADSLGRLLGNDEVRALEGIAGALSGNGERSQRGYDQMEE